MIYALAAGLLIGYALAYFGYREERKWLRHELTVAHAQIAHAVVKDGAMIPPRLEPVKPPDPLPKDLQAVVDDWEGAESRAVEEARIRQWMAEGWKVDSILRQYRGGTI